tara:strand:+ start:5070 stop:6386 length:1317 start_codon:yes stop_codon:yes gene_type:complete
MSSRLNQKDLDLINVSGQTMDLASQEFAYIGGEFTKNSDDYVEALIFDTNETFLESGVVEKTDYTYDDGTVKLNTGTILRRMGYDRGRYVVRYNFLRKVAGSYETVLVDKNNQIYNGSFHRTNDGKIMSGVEPTDSSFELFLKENKYFVHQISPSRREIRLAPQSIADKKYKDDFYYAQKEFKKITIPDIVEFVAANNELKADSKTLKVTGNTRLNAQMVGGFVSVDNAFIKEYLPPPGDQTQPGEAPQTEVDSSTVQARFIISDNSAAQYKSGDTNLVGLFERFKGLSDSTLPTNTDNFIFSDKTKGLRGIRVVDVNSLVKYKFTSGQAQRIALRSVSSKPNVGTKYTWEVTGWDYDKGNGFATIRANTASSEGDVTIVSPQPQGASLLQVTENSTNGSELIMELWSKHLSVGIKLTIEPKDAEASSIYIPGFIFTE